jgi:hypothetical protein
MKYREGMAIKEAQKVEPGGSRADQPAYDTKTPMLFA